MLKKGLVYDNSVSIIIKWRSYCRLFSYSNIVNRACKDINEDTDTEIMWSFLERVEGIKIHNLSEPKNSIITERMTLDYEEDYIKLLEVLRLVGPFANRREISECLLKNPKLNEINASKNNEWKKIKKISLLNETYSETKKYVNIQ